MYLRTHRGLLLGTILVVSTVVGACREEGAVAVRTVSFRGVDAVEQPQLRGVLATRQSSRLPWGRQYAFDHVRFEADLKRIEAFYADRGYPDARATADVTFNDERNAVDVAFTVEEGKAVLLAAVDLIGFDVIPSERLEELSLRVSLRVGAPRDRQLLMASQERALNELREHGYPYATVAWSEGSAGGRDVVVALTADPGPPAVFGPIEIRGQRSVGEEVIRRQLGFRTGDLYRRSVVQDTQRRLYAIELFQFVNIETLDSERQDPEMRARVTVAEGNHQRVRLGAGYGTEEQARVDGEYHHVNFLGGARSAGVHARWSSLDRGVRIDVIQPYLFHAGMSLGAEGQQWYTFTPGYQSIVTGGKATVTHRSSQATALSLSLSHERNSSTISNDALTDLALRNDLIALGLDPTTGTQEGTLNAFGVDLQRSTTDSPLNATRGYQLALHMEVAGKVLPGSFNYYAFSADGRHYLPLGSGVVLANRLQLGTIEEAGDDPGNVPFAKKYFLGGATSVRGWGRYEVSPISGSGLPIGGNSLFSFSSEIRTVLTGKVGGVLFLDGGNVWTDGWGMRLGDLHYAVGPGLRYQTPVGPIRLDVGYQLNPIEGLLVSQAGEQPRRWRVHFSIGQAF